MEKKCSKFGACTGFLEVKNGPWSVAHTRIPDITRKFLHGIFCLFSMGYFKNTTVWGGIMPPNFVVSSSIPIKFGVLIEIDKFFKNSQKCFENNVTAEL